MPLPAALRAAAQPIKPFMPGDRLPFRSMRAHPLARQHKQTLCFAFSHLSPQTRMFERQAAAAAGNTPPPSCWPPVPAEQEPSQGSHAEAKWVSGVQGVGWQNQRSNQGRLWARRPGRLQPRSQNLSPACTTLSGTRTFLIMLGPAADCEVVGHPTRMIAISRERWPYFWSFITELEKEERFLSGKSVWGPEKSEKKTPQILVTTPK